MNLLVNDATFKLELNAEVAEKLSIILNDESLMHAGFVAHQSNNAFGQKLNDNAIALASDVKVAA